MFLVLCQSIPASCCPSPVPLQGHPLPAVPAVLSSSSAHPQHPQVTGTFLSSLLLSSHPQRRFYLLLCLSRAMWAQNSNKQRIQPPARCPGVDVLWVCPQCGAALLPCGTCGNGWAGQEMHPGFVSSGPVQRGFHLSVSCREAPGTCTC